MEFLAEGARAPQHPRSGTPCQPITPFPLQQPSTPQILRYCTNSLPCMQAWRSSWPMTSKRRTAICRQPSQVISTLQTYLYALSLRRRERHEDMGLPRTALKWLISFISMVSLHLLLHLIGLCCLSHMQMLPLPTGIQSCSMLHHPRLHLKLSNTFKSSADCDPSFSETWLTSSSNPAWLSLPVPDASCSTRPPSACAEYPPRHTLPDLGQDSC